MAPCNHIARIHLTIEGVGISITYYMGLFVLSTRKFKVKLTWLLETIKMWENEKTKNQLMNKKKTKKFTPFW